MPQSRYAYSFESSERIRERHGGEEQHGDPCVRGEWCSGYRIQRDPDGTVHRLPARSPRPFCDACQGYIGECLGKLPSAYDRLQAEVAELASGGHSVRSPFGPKLPGPKLAAVDAAMRLMPVVLRSWEARTRSTARWSVRDPRASIFNRETVQGAVDTLQGTLSTLLVLSPGWMTRTVPLAPGRHGKPAVISEEVEHLYGEMDVVRVGVDSITIMLHLDAVAAGTEIIELERKARAVLGETRAQAETFDGVPCRQCGAMALERAEPPSDPKIEALHSRCAGCGHAMTADTYNQWAGWYARWAATSVPECKRCQRGQHEECRWEACGCGRLGHVTETAAA